MNELKPRKSEISKEDFLKYAIKFIQNDTCPCIFADPETKRILLYKGPNGQCLAGNDVIALDGEMIK